MSYTVSAADIESDQGTASGHLLKRVDYGECIANHSEVPGMGLSAVRWLRYAVDGAELNLEVYLPLCVEEEYFFEPCPPPNPGPLHEQLDCPQPTLHVPPLFPVRRNGVEIRVVSRLLCPSYFGIANILGGEFTGTNEQELDCDGEDLKDFLRNKFARNMSYALPLMKELLVGARSSQKAAWLLKTQRLAFDMVKHFEIRYLIKATKEMKSPTRDLDFFVIFNEPLGVAVVFEPEAAGSFSSYIKFFNTTAGGDLHAISMNCIAGCFTAGIDSSEVELGSDSNAARSARRASKQLIVEAASPKEVGDSVVIILEGVNPLRGADDAASALAKNASTPAVFFDFGPTRRIVALNGGSSHALNAELLVKSFDTARSECVSRGSAQGLEFVAKALVEDLDGNQISLLMGAFGFHGIEIIRSLCRQNRVRCRVPKQVDSLLADISKQRYLSSLVLDALGLIPEPFAAISPGPHRSVSGSGKRQRHEDAPSTINNGHSRHVYDNDDDGRDNFDGTVPLHVKASAPVPHNAYIDYEAQAKLQAKLLSCSTEFGYRYRHVACPTYQDNSNGKITHGKYDIVTIVDFNPEENDGVSGVAHITCSCSHAIKAATQARVEAAARRSDPQFLFAGPTAEAPSCFHCRLVERNKYVETELPQEGTYHVPLVEYPDRAQLFVQYRPPDIWEKENGAICMVTSGHISCDACHSNKPQDAFGDAYCRHVAHIVDFAADDESADKYATSLFKLINKNSGTAPTSQVIFDKVKGNWWFPSLSAVIEAETRSIFGDDPIIMPSRLQALNDIPDRRPSYMGGPSDPEAFASASFEDVLYFIPVIPNNPNSTPRHNQDRCVYFNEENPAGFVSREQDDASHRFTDSVVYFQTHSRRGKVFVRNCCMDHVECRRRWPGSDGYYHRHSTLTIAAAELPLMAFEFMINAHGPGMEAFVRQVEDMYATAGSPRYAHGSRFMGVDTFRDVFFGYFCRTNFDANRPCPTCPILKDALTGDWFSDCKNLTADGQRVRLRKSVLRRAPTMPHDGAPVVDCRDYSLACERLVWPPGGPSSTNGKARLILSEVCEALLSSNGFIANHSLQVRITVLRGIITTPSYEGYSGAINAVLSTYERRCNGDMSDLTSYEKALLTTMSTVCHSQSEATQFLPSDTHEFVREVLLLCDLNGFDHSDHNRWFVDNGVRRSLLTLVWASRIENIGGGKPYTIRPEIFRFLSALDFRVQEIKDVAVGMHNRIEFSPESRPVYDPTTGEAYHFNKSGSPWASWPEFSRVKSERNCDDCTHPDWYKTGRRGMSDGDMNIGCVDSYTIRGFHFMLGHESKADAAAAVYCNAKRAPKSLILDTPCQHAPFVNSRTSFYYWTQFMADRWHRLKHTCRRVFNPDDFARFQATNTSFIEQYHSLQGIMKKMVAGATMEHASFYICLLIDFHYNRRCDDMGIPNDSPLRRWPDS